LSEVVQHNGQTTTDVLLPQTGEIPGVRLANPWTVSEAHLGLTLVLSPARPV